MEQTKEKTTEIAVPDGAQEVQAAEAPPVMDAVAIWKSIETLALNPDVDAAKIGALLDHQERIMDRAAKQAYIFAKNAAMAEMPKITKDSKIVHPGKNGAPDRLIGRYKKYEDLRRAIDPILEKHGLHISHDPGFNDQMKMPTVAAVLSFAKGGMAWVERGTPMPIPLDTTGAKSGAQSAGSSATYGYRYTTCAILGIVIENEDNDGQEKQAQLQDKEAEDDLLTNAEEASSRGTLPYRAFFEGLTNVQRSWLVANGKDDEYASHHDRLKNRGAQNDDQTEEGKG